MGRGSDSSLVTCHSSLSFARSLTVAARIKRARLLTRAARIKQPNLDRARVGFQAFPARQADNRGRELPKTARRELLHRNDLHEVEHRKAAPEARHASGRENVVRTGGVISRGFRTVRADEDAPGIANLVERKTGRHRQMFRRKLVGQRNRFVPIADDDNGAVILERRRSGSPRWRGSSKT